jgi:protein N-terminal methyltransferase
MPNLFASLPRDDQAEPSSKGQATPQLEPDGSDLQEPVFNASSLIDQSAAITYWSSISADDTGVLGGYPQVSRVDLQGSANFLAKLKRKNIHYGRHERLKRAVDCGAGIGRITKGFLSKVAEVVDIVEPVEKLTRVVAEDGDFKSLRDEGRIGKIYNAGLEAWTPATTYTLIWNQWCLGQLTDAQLVDYLKRCIPHLEKGGWVVVKENMSTDAEGRDIFDGTDSSVTRTDDRFREVFKKAGLRIVASEVQKGMPKDIYPVRSYALQPEGGWKE